MRKVLLSFLFGLFAFYSYSATWYLAPKTASPAGNDANVTNSITTPWFELEKVWPLLSAGDIVYLRGGTYEYDDMQYLDGKNGTSGNLIKIWAYPGETPLITRSSSYTVVDGVDQDLIYFEGNYFHWLGLEIAYFDQKEGDYAWSAFRTGFTNNSIYENLNYHHNGAGMSIRGNSSNNLILNCDFWANQDPYSDEPYDGSDGLDFHYISAGTTNTIRGCRAWWNADDGFDFWENYGYILMEDCWAFWNGYIPETFSPAGNGTGIKLGSTNNQINTLLRTIRNCISFRNRNHGIVENGAICKSDIFNNLVGETGDHGYWFGSWGSNVATLRNNIAIDVDGDDARLSVNDVHSNNTWNGGVTVSSADFVSYDDSQLDDARGENNTLPIITFGHLAETSDLIDAGTDVGLPFNGDAPDIGPFEYSADGNAAPTANAGDDQTITLPTNSVTLSGSGADLDGSVVSYTWTKISGGNATIVSANEDETEVTGLEAGVYVFRLTVEDNDGATDSDDVTITVNEAGNNIFRYRGRPIIQLP